MKTKKDLNISYIWTSNGRIYLRKSQDSPVIPINNKDNLKKTVSKLSKVTMVIRVMSYLHCSCGENSREINSDRANEVRTFPFLSITSPVSNISHLTNLDIDKHMPLDSNFGFYTTHEFHSNNDTIQCLSHYFSQPCIAMLEV